MKECILVPESVEQLYLSSAKPTEIYMPFLSGTHGEGTAPTRAILSSCQRTGIQDTEVSPSGVVDAHLFWPEVVSEKPASGVGRFNLLMSYFSTCEDRYNKEELH